MKSMRISGAICLMVMLALMIPLENAMAIPAMAPAAPTSLTATYYPPLTATLKWKDNSKDETNFLVNVSYSMPSDNSQCADCVTVWVSGSITQTLAANSTTVNLKMQAGGKYKLTVQAKNKSGSSAKSNEVTVHAPPVPPSNLNVTRVIENKKTKEIKVSWKDNANNEGMNIVVVGYQGGMIIYGYKPNKTSDAIPASAIPASAIPASAKIEIKTGAIPASAIPASFKNNRDAIPASALNVLKIPLNSDVKYLTTSSYLPLFFGSNLVTK